MLAPTGLLVNSYVCLYVSQDQMVNVKVSRWTGHRRPIKRYKGLGVRELFPLTLVHTEVPSYD